MKLIIPSTHAKKVEVPLTADVRKAFEKYAKNVKTVDPDNETITPEVALVSYLATFAESAEFTEMNDKALNVKAEQKAARERLKAEKEAKKAERAALAEQKKAEKIAKLQAEIDKLKED